jgi:hypothetical protein
MQARFFFVIPNKIFVLHASEMVWSERHQKANGVVCRTFTCIVFTLYIGTVASIIETGSLLFLLL